VSDKYVKLRSWHIASGIESRGGQVKLLCGRWATVRATLTGSLHDPGEPQQVALTTPLAESFGNEKTCESCFRIEAINR
jgi:hypothetical protein